MTTGRTPVAESDDPPVMAPGEGARTGAARPDAEGEGSRHPHEAEVAATGADAPGRDRLEPDRQPSARAAVVVLAALMAAALTTTAWLILLHLIDPTRDVGLGALALLPGVCVLLSLPVIEVAARLAGPGGFSLSASVDRRTLNVAALAWLALSLNVWALSLFGIDQDNLGDVGLVSALPPLFYLPLAMLVGGFAALLRRPVNGHLLGAYLGGLIVTIHATPPLVYDTLRYSWAWKHVAVTDYIQRNGSVDPTIDSLDVYHNWPGFFVGNATFNEITGIASSSTIAGWTPLVVTLLIVAASITLFRAFTADDRLIWLGGLLIVVSNWVGQDYYSPQAFAFVMYLAIVALLLRDHRRDESAPAWARRLRLGRSASPPPPPLISHRAVSLGLILVLSIALISSHALTSLLLVLTAAGLVVTRSAGPRWLPLALAGLVGLWSATFSREYLIANIGDSLFPPAFGLGGESGKVTEDYGGLSSGQVAVSSAGRALVLLLLVLAVVAIVRLARGRRIDPALAVLAGAPLLLLVAGSYEGEAVFRVYLFGLPVICLFAADALLNLPRLRGAGTRLVISSVVAMLLGMFLLAHFGKDDQYVFSRDELAAAELVYSAPGRTLVVEGTRNYPGPIRRYENFRNVPIDRERADAKRRILADPAGVLGGWLSDDTFQDAYVILTRSQRAEVEQLGALPRGSLEALEASLRQDPDFITVFDRPDAVVFTLRSRGPG